MKSLLETIDEFPLSVNILLTLSLARSVSFFCTATVPADLSS